MKKILLLSAAVLAIVLIVLSVIICLQPGEFRVERSTVIDAPPDVIFPHVNDLSGWQAWSPWAKLDPQAKESFSGPASGTGAVFSWSGNSDVGEGSMTITASRPHEFIGIRLDFVKPFVGTNDVEFHFTPEGESTRVRWSMSGKSNFISKAMGLVIDCDQMIGGMYEQGLARLKTTAETTP